MAIMPVAIFDQWDCETQEERCLTASPLAIRAHGDGLRCVTLGSICGRLARPVQLPHLGGLSPPYSRHNWQNHPYERSNGQPERHVLGPPASGRSR